MSRWLALALALVLVTGSGLRLHDLDERSLWADELFTLSIATHHPLIPEHGQVWFERKQVNQIAEGDSFLTAKAAEQNPPLYDLLIKATSAIATSPETTPRLPSALAACALVLWFAAFALRHPDPVVRRTLPWASLLLALHPSLVLYAQEGRAYSTGTTLLGMGGLLWMLRWRLGATSWTAPGRAELTLFVLACLSHYIAALVVALLLMPDAWMALK